MWENRLLPYVVKKKHCCTFIAALSKALPPKSSCVGRGRLQKIRYRSKQKKEALKSSQSRVASSVLLEVPPLASVFLKYTTSTSPLGDKCGCNSPTDVWW